MKQICRPTLSRMHSLFCWGAALCLLSSFLIGGCSKKKGASFSSSKVEIATSLPKVVPPYTNTKAPLNLVQAGMVAGTFFTTIDDTTKPSFTLSAPGTPIKSDLFPVGSPFSYQLPVGLYTIDVIAAGYYKIAFPNVNIKLNHILKLPSFFPLIAVPADGAPGILILNSGIETLTTPKVQLFIVAQSDVTTMQLAESPEGLAAAPSQLFSSLPMYTFSDTSFGRKNLYVQFSNGTTTYPPIFDSVNLVDPNAPPTESHIASTTDTKPGTDIVTEGGTAPISSTGTEPGTDPNTLIATGPVSQIPTATKGFHDKGCSASLPGVGFLVGGFPAQSMLEAIIDSATQPTVTTLEASRYFCSAIGSDTHLVVAGGYNNTGAPESTIEDYIWDATQKTLTETKSGLSLGTPRIAPALVALPPLLLVAGGNNDVSVEVFQLNPTAIVAKIPTSITSPGSGQIALQSARTQVAGAALGTGSALFAGGINITTDNSKSNVVDVFSLMGDATTPQLSTNPMTATLSTARSQATAVSMGDFVIVAGGLEAQEIPSRVIDIFGQVQATALIGDQVRNIGIQVQNVGTLTMAEGRTLVSAVVAGNYLFLAGGATAAPGGFTPTTDRVEIFQLTPTATPQLTLVTTLKLSTKRTSIYGVALSATEVIFTGGTDPSEPTDADKVIDIFQLNGTTWSLNAPK